MRRWPAGYQKLNSCYYTTFETRWHQRWHKRFDTQEPPDSLCFPLLAKLRTQPYPPCGYWTGYKQYGTWYIPGMPGSNILGKKSITHICLSLFCLYYIYKRIYITYINVLTISISVFMFGFIISGCKNIPMLNLRLLLYYSYFYPTRSQWYLVCI